MPIVWENGPSPSEGVGGAAEGGVWGKGLPGAWKVASAGMDSKSMAAMESGAKELLNSAESGGFRVSEEAAKPIRDALLQARNDIDSLINDFGRLVGQELGLGDHDYGQIVSRHQREAFASGSGSPLETLRKLQSVVIDADLALENAVQKYREFEESSLESLKDVNL